jgi:HSP20 family protein
MTLVKYNSKPFSLLDSFFNDDFFRFDEFLPSSFSNTFTPLGDVIEHDDKFQLELMLPAFSKEDFKLEVNDGVLSIEGERKVNEDVKYKSKQSYFGRFKKSYTLPDNVETDNINASYENGVLKIEIPKVEVEISKPKLIEVV